MGYGLGNESCMTAILPLRDRLLNHHDECGHNYENDGRTFGGTDVGERDDASFVHLPPTALSHDRSAAPTPSSFIDTYNHLLTLGSVATSGSEQALCLECVERVRNALEQDTDRLERECEMYQETTKNEHWRQESLKRAMHNILVSDTSGPSGGQGINSETLLPSYAREIERLRESCRMQRDEVAELIRLQKAQIQLARDLDDIEWNIEEHQNFLELEARGFDNAEEQAWKQLSEATSELEQLTSVQLRLPAMVFDLQVDKERGLRYPLINGLRLAYRPKGDVEKVEIQAAWSLAAQLLLTCGTLLQYQSQTWKIVPLSSGAKLIRRTGSSSSNERDCIVYNLGHPKATGSEALLAWNDLMHGVVQHTLSVQVKAGEMGQIEPSVLGRLPFDTTQTSIGGINLLHLDANDDSGWSRAIHCLSSNLLWISDCASKFLLEDVVMLSQS